MMSPCVCPHFPPDSAPQTVLARAGAWPRKPELTPATGRALRWVCRVPAPLLTQSFQLRSRLAASTLLASVSLFAASDEKQVIRPKPLNC